jgi:hypothetical protein
MKLIYLRLEVSLLAFHYNLDPADEKAKSEGEI